VPRCAVYYRKSLIIPCIISNKIFASKLQVYILAIIGPEIEIILLDAPLFLSLLLDYKHTILNVNERDGTENKKCCPAEFSSNPA